MTAALIRKELHQHWWAFLLIGLLSMLGIGWILLFTVLQGQAGSHLFALRLHAFLIAASALILGNRLVVAEYGARTQIFLESLPLPRLRIVLVKYFLGLAVILLCATAGLGVAMAAGARTEVFTPRFIGILSARYLCYAAFAYGFFFAMGFLGRYRFAAYALIIAGIALMTKTRDIEVNQLAPIDLVGATFPFEREVYPETSLLVTGGLTLAFFLLACLLATTREGSVSSLLGERMSYRDKISLTALIFGLLSALFVLDESKTKEPYEMTDGVEATDTRIASVKVAPDTPEAAALADRLGRDLDSMADFLGLETLPPVFLIERPDLDPDQFEHGFLDSAEGTVLRTPFAHPDWRYEECLERISGEVVDAVSNGRLMKEDRFWVIDGFSLYWPHRGDGDTTAPLDRDRHLLLRALYGTEIIGGLKTPADLRHWFSHQKAVGHEITAGIGWSLLRCLERTAGPEPARAFMRSVLAADTPKNALTTIRDLRDPIEERFRRHTGLELADFLGTWNAELDSWREQLAEPLARIPRLTGEFTFDGEPGATSQIRFHFEPPRGADSDQLDRPVLLYGETAVFENALPEAQLKREPLSVSETREGWLPDTWGTGAGIAWTFAADQPQLRCRIISGWNHSFVP